MRRGSRNRGSDENSRRREEIARGKQRVESDDDFEVDEEMEDVESPRDLGGEEMEDALTDDEMKILSILLDMKLEGTKYPDRNTMGKLRIADDLDEMFDNLGVGTFMLKRHDSYKKATCLFLASLQLHLCSSGQLTPDGSDAYISFCATGQRHHLSFREIDRAYYLRHPSNRHGLGVQKDELKALWETIASGEYQSKTAKSAQIRSPPIRYMHKAIANTFYPRYMTGTVNESELSMIDVALTGILPRLNNGERLKGSTSNGGITLALIEQLLSYQHWALANAHRRHDCELRMGGLVTPLLYAVGFIPEETEEVAQPEAIDHQYLKNCNFLQKTPDGGDLIYQFTHLQFGKSRMLLPNPGWTAIRGGSNIDFNPPISVLRTRSTTPAYSTPPTNRDRAGQSRQDADEPVDEFEHFHFEEYTPAARQSAGMKVAHERISVLQLWNKAQDKVTNKLRKKIKKMANQIKTLQDRLSCNTSSEGVRRSTAPVNAQPADLFEDELDHTTTGVRAPFPDQPRHSSFEPRQRKRRTREHQIAGPSEARADTDLPFRRCSSVSRPTAPTDYQTPLPSASEPDLSVPQPAAPAGSSSVPPYTQANLDEAIDSLFQFHH